MTSVRQISGIGEQLSHIVDYTIRHNISSRNNIFTVFRVLLSQSSFFLRYIFVITKTSTTIKHSPEFQKLKRNSSKQFLLGQNISSMSHGLTDYPINYPPWDVTRFFRLRTVAETLKNYGKIFWFRSGITNMTILPAFLLPGVKLTKTTNQRRSKYTKLKWNC